MTKIYIIGAVGSGKTTLARKLSKRLNIKYYELDNITWEHNIKGSDRKRTDTEITKIFNKILLKDEWIIENVGKKIYTKGYDFSDIIIYIDLKRRKLYFRIFIRWLKQNLNLYPTPTKPTFAMLKQMLRWATKELNNSKLNDCKKYKNKLIILNKKELNNFEFIIQEINKNIEQNSVKGCALMKKK